MKVGKREKKQTKNVKAKEPVLKVTMADLEAMSSSDEEGGLPPEETWGEDAKDLKKAIESGVFDNLLSKYGQAEGDDDSIEEVDLDDEEENGDEANVLENSEDAPENEGDEGNSSEESDEDNNPEQNNISDKEKPSVEHEMDEESDSDDDNTESTGEEHDDDDETKNKSSKPKSKLDSIQEKNNVSSKAMRVATETLVAEKKSWHWAETFAVMPTTPLPFGNGSDADGNPLSVHDDLKREVAFYDNALEAVMEAKKKCIELSIPFSRPDDFFAEMVKTDEHMARVKDRLIFETKKIDAVAQRKTNKEQKLRSKESVANKLAEKSKRKKDHFKQVDDWAQSAAANRGRTLTDNDDGYLRSLNNGEGTKGKKRMIADKKYGFGGKKGRFKQNDPKDLNDMSGFNPRGNFAGVGTKKTVQKTGSGSNRKGKRARDASRGRS